MRPSVAAASGVEQQPAYSRALWAGVLALVFVTGLLLGAFVTHANQCRPLLRPAWHALPQDVISPETRPDEVTSAMEPPLLPMLAAAEARRNPGLPYLFDADAQPTPEEACQHCSDQSVMMDGSKNDELRKTPDPIFCCGVCQYEGRHCKIMAPPGAMEKHLVTYERELSFDFRAFAPEELWSRIKGRTLWMMGDSQTWHWYYAVECFLRRFAVDLVRRPLTTNMTDVDLLTPTKGPVYVKPMCIHLQGDTRVCVVRADTVPAITRQVLPALVRVVPDIKQDILILQTGLHYPPNAAYANHLADLSMYTAQHKEELPNIIWKSTPVQHFASPRGAFDRSKLGKQCVPLKAWQDGDWKMTHGGPYNTLIAGTVAASGWAVLDTWNATVPLWDMHRTGECTHWCSPSAYHVWLFLLNRLLEQTGIGTPLPSGAAFRPL